MTIQAIIDNLRDTIDGKNLYLEECRAQQLLPGVLSQVEHILNFSVIQMLELNISELEKILVDLESVK